MPTESQVIAFPIAPSLAVLMECKLNPKMIAAPRQRLRHGSRSDPKKTVCIKVRLSTMETPEGLNLANRGGRRQDLLRVSKRLLIRRS
jgi:hypothetical protein